VIDIIQNIFIVLLIGFGFRNLMIIGILRKRLEDLELGGGFDKKK
jgi:hypothetical protein